MHHHPKYFFVVRYTGQVIVVLQAGKPSYVKVKQSHRCSKYTTIYNGTSAHLRLLSPDRLLDYYGAVHAQQKHCTMATCHQLYAPLDHAYYPLTPLQAMYPMQYEDFGGWGFMLIGNNVHMPSDLLALCPWLEPTCNKSNKSRQLFSPEPLQVQWMPRLHTTPFTKN